MTDAPYRTERDSMGEVRVPAQALWGAQTQRAVQNFHFSGLPLPRGPARVTTRRASSAGVATPR
mgnify:CR=1 FL=1